MKRSIAVLLILILCVGLLTLPAAADGQGPSKQEIREKWNTVTSASTIFTQEPSIHAPYATGELSDDFLTSGITYLNYVRFVAGLPEVKLDDTLNDKAQHGAVCLAAIDELTHYPSRPADMDEQFYDTAAEATASSNISARWGYPPLESLQSAVSGCMGDNSSINNLSTVGHRRWLLNPTLGKVGFGYAQSETGWSYIVNHVHDRSGNSISYDYIAWPVAGNQPTNLFDITDPWSVSLNPNQYKAPKLNDLSITITQQSDGKTWTFDSQTGEPSDHRFPYMTVNNQWYGVPNCIIFHPGSLLVEEYAGVYTVEISGLYTKSGNATELCYEVDFFDLEECQHEFADYKKEPTCTQEGYTCQRCTICGLEQNRNNLPMTGHNWESGICTRCGAVDETYVPKFKISFANMTLGNSLAMNFAFEQGHRDDWTGCYAEIVKEYADGRPDKVITIPYAQWGSAGINGVKHFTLKFDGVAAKEMSDNVFVTIYDATGNAISDTWEDSVRGYAMRTLNNPKTSRESFIMVVDLLNYGAAAQSYFKYNTGDLANNQMTEAQKAMATPDAPAEDIREKGANYKGTNLGLESQILMRMAFGGTTEDMYATIAFTNHSGKKVMVNLSGSEFGSTGTITIDELVLADGRKPVAVTIYNADGTVFASATDSMESYIARMRRDKYDPLFEAILKFSDSAYNFFH